LAVNALFEHVGYVESISPVFKSPALGFKGDDFLNCVVQLSSHFSPKKVLNLIQKIEKDMGRVRKPDKEITSRTIDIDILFYDDICIETDQLVIPHPELHHRKFVLVPVARMNKHLVHPLLNETIELLLKDTKDNSEISLYSKQLKNPMNNFDISGYRYIAIEGNIGAGKTSLATMMAYDFNAKLILERFQENAFLPMFYKDPVRFAFPLEMSFLADRYQQLLDDLTQYDLFKEYIIADYDCFKSMIFANITLQDEEYNLYKKIFHIMYKELPNPDVYIYLYQNTERLLENIKHRGRTFEQDIEASYLNKINQGYMDFIKNQHSDNIRVIDISDMDFIKNRSDYIKILNEIVG
jgi:2-amino-4-hydroxy-6-hydroxymethyldihydropteridine diphosphokinase